MDQVFPRMCFDGKGHNVQLAPASGVGHDDRTLYCNRCGDSVPMSVAVARTPTPTIGIKWPTELHATSGGTDVRS